MLLTEGAQTQNITLIYTALPLEGVCSFPFVGPCKILTIVDTKQYSHFIIELFRNGLFMR